MSTENSEPTESPSAIVLGFARGIAPSKWARRWKQATGLPIELRAVNVAFGEPSGGQLVSAAKRARLAEAQLQAQADAAAAAAQDDDVSLLGDSDGTAAASLAASAPLSATVDVMIERAAPGEFPAGSRGDDRRRHALRLYAEAVALVVPADHDLAELESLTTNELAEHLAAGDITLLDHPDHASEWPAAEPWADPSWKPRNPAAALHLVAAGTGAILLPLPLARHLVGKREHAIIALHGEPEIAQSTVWATWALDRDAPDVQQLAGIMRGRTARSSRPGADTDPAAERTGGERAKKTGAKKPQPTSKKPGPKPGSRGAQLAASKKKPKHISRPKPKSQQKPRRRK